MKKLIFFLSILYFTISNAQESNGLDNGIIKSSKLMENGITGSGKLISRESKYNVPYPDIKKNTIHSQDNSEHDDYSESAWSPYIENAVSKDGNLHNYQTDSFFALYIKNDFSESSVWATVELYQCINNKNCNYEKLNYELYKNTYMMWNGMMLLTNREFKETGSFEMESIIILTCEDIGISSKSTNTINIY